MRRFIMLVSVFVVACAFCAPAQAPSKTDKVPGVSNAAKKTHNLITYDGVMVRFNADKNTLDLSKGNREKTVVFDEKTEWIVDGKTVATKEEFKIGKHLIADGTMDDSGRIFATKITLRRMK